MILAVRISKRWHFYQAGSFYSWQLIMPDLCVNEVPRKELI